jgi:FtsP/CotA-like multicopper oxidase with cupredoxin domain
MGKRTLAGKTREGRSTLAALDLGATLPTAALATNSEKEVSMGPQRLARILTLLTLALALAALPARAQNPFGDILVQCKGDLNGDAVPDPCMDPNLTSPSDCDGGGGEPDPNLDYDPNVLCRHVSGGDGFTIMADGQPLYFFGFAPLGGFTDNTAARGFGPTGDPTFASFLPSEAMDQGRLRAQNPSPSIVLEQGMEFYLNLTNVGMMVRPDLFDEHTIHFHAFPEAAPVFDGVPDSSIFVGMGATLSYYYNLEEAGTYIYHCHVEATEHMQMGMMGNLYVRASQDRFGVGGTQEVPTASRSFRWGGSGPYGYVFNDGLPETDPGSTAYDVEVPLQIMTFDPNFHHASYLVQPLPFRDMRDTYPMLNGRGYPDTVNTDPNYFHIADVDGWQVNQISQPMHTLIEANSGDRILFRISSVSVTQFITLTTDLGVPFKVVGIDAKWLGPENYYEANVLDLGGGQVLDAIVDTTGVPAGTYFLYTNNTYNLSNDEEDFGGLMTEIQIN